MKKLTLILSIFALASNLFAENGLPEETNANVSNVSSEVSITKPSVSNDIVINHALIEKFNNAEYNEDQLSFGSLIENYSFQEIKQISLAYKNGDIETISDASLKNYKKKNFNNDSWLQLYSESELPANLK